MSTTNYSTPRVNTTDNVKAGSVKAMQILIIVRALIALAFYIVFAVKDITIGTVGPQIILYSFLAFVVLAIPIFYFIHKRNLVATRIAILVDLLAAVPASAFISIGLSLLVFGLSFTKSAKTYFNG